MVATRIFPSFLKYIQKKALLKMHLKPFEALLDHVFFQLFGGTPKKHWLSLRNNWPLNSVSLPVCFVDKMPISCLELDGQCFEDPRGGRVLPHGPWTGDMTIDKCKKRCTGEWYSTPYKYAGVEFAKECWCGNDRPTLPAPDTDCSLPCTGDKSEICGGGHRINVYQL